MHVAEFIQDLAVIMLIAGAVTVIFHRLKQPVVLGYIVAGVIIGPYTPPFNLIHDELTIKTLAELGIVFLLFSLGLEFSLRKLARVGGGAIVAALFEIIVMIWIGYEIGRFFGWATMDSIFLGAILSISSTTIIVKALDELKMKRERFAHLIFGILIVEDIIGIGIIALLSAIATTGMLSSGTAFTTMGKLGLFMTIALVLGILIIPRLLSYVAKFKSNEMLLVTVLGICFGFCLLVIKLDYSIALGAFIIGAVMAESRQTIAIEKLIEPIRDMFSAIFFVTIGLLLDPSILITYVVPVAIISAAVVIGKVLTCSVGTFLGGRDIRTSLRVGMGLSQIGEFSFIIASLGITLNVTSSFLYPIAVAVSAVTTFLTPYLIKLADPLSVKLENHLPFRIKNLFSVYTTWLQNIQPQGNNVMLAKMIRRIIIQVFVNIALVAAIFIAAAYFGEPLIKNLNWITDKRIENALILGCALVISLPFLIAAYRKMQGLSMILSELAIKPNPEREKYILRTRRVMAEVIPSLFIAGIMLLIAALSSAILPPAELILGVLIIAAILSIVLWRRFIRLHAKLQNALLEILEENKD